MQVLAFRGVWVPDEVPGQVMFEDPSLEIGTTGRRGGAYHPRRFTARYWKCYRLAWFTFGGWNVVLK